MLEKEILLNIESKEIRYAQLKNGQLNNLMVERKAERQLTGNIYKGQVTNILDNIQSAFVNIGEGENGFIHISDILENTKKLEESFQIDFDLDEEQSTPKEEKESSQNIAEHLKMDQNVLVQVVKEPIGSKGARLTSNISLAGRYLVLLPNSAHRGISRKVEDWSERDRLRKIIKSLKLPSSIGLICRTAARHANAEMIQDEAQDLLDQWNYMCEQFQESKGPTCLYEESDIIKRAVLTAVDKRYDRMLVDDYETFQICKRLYSKYAHEHTVRIEYYRDRIPMFERFNVEREIEKALKRKIWLASGGYLYFDKTEAMTTIDVNSGRSSTGHANLEETLVRINLEAAEEISRQLRLRNTGGLIICDFIDMRYKKNQRRVLEKLKEFMKEDSAKCTILGMSDFGLVEMTRQRTRESLAQTMFHSCPYCTGMGMIKNPETISIEIERALKKAILYHQNYALRLTVHPEILDHMNAIDTEYLCDLAQKLNARLEFHASDDLHLNDYHFQNSLNDQVIEV